MKHQRVLNIKLMSSTVSQSSIRMDKICLSRWASQGHGIHHKAVGSTSASFSLWRRSYAKGLSCLTEEATTRYQFSSFYYFTKKVDLCAFLRYAV